MGENDWVRLEISPCLHGDLLHFNNAKVLETSKPLTFTTYIVILIAAVRFCRNIIFSTKLLKI